MATGDYPIIDGSINIRDATYGSVVDTEDHMKLRQNLVDILVEMGIADIATEEKDGAYEGWTDDMIIGAFRTAFKLGQMNRAGVARELMED